MLTCTFKIPWTSPLPSSQNFGVSILAAPCITLMSLSEDFSEYTWSGGIESRSSWAETLTRGITERKISTAMNIEANGSNPAQPNCFTSRVDMITPTEPIVSARTCRKIPCILALTWPCAACP